MNNLKTLQGIVLYHTKGFYYVENDQHKVIECSVKGKLFKESKFDNQLVVGDIVHYQIDQNEQGIIMSFEERNNFFSRARNHISHNEQIIAANIDQVCILVAIKEPDFKLNFVCRLLTAANYGGVKPIIIITKSDLSDQNTIAQIQTIFQEIAIPVFSYSIFQQTEKEKILALLQDKKSLLVGHSGVGKSSLVNTILPDLHLQVKAVGKRSQKGRHTTSLSTMHVLNSSSYIIDSPGFREFVPFGIDKMNLKTYFPLFEQFENQCQFKNCQHITEQNCIVQEMLNLEKMNNDLYESYKAIFHSI